MKTLGLVLVCALAHWSCATSSPTRGGGSPYREAVDATVPLPSWVQDPGSHSAYPTSRYLTAVGHAQVEGQRGLALEQATENGRKQISAQLNANLQGVTEIYMREVGVDQEYVSSTDYLQEVRTQTASLFFGSRQVEQYFDDRADALYVLVVLEREPHARALLKKVDAALAKTDESSQPSSGAGRLRDLIEEHARLEAVMPSLFTLDLVVPRNRSLRTEFDQRYHQAKQRIQEVLAAYRDAGITVRAVAGDRQRGHAHEDLAEPIVFEARMGGSPLVGFPVRFETEHPEQSELVSASQQTGPDGRFSCRVVGLLLTGDEENEVHAHLDFVSLGERAISEPGATVSFSLPTLRSTTFSFAIDETNLDRPVKESVVTARLKEALAAREARVIELDAFLSRRDRTEALQADPNWLRERLGGQVDYLFRGTARSRFNSSQNGIQFCYAGGRLELIDLRTGIVLAPYEVPLSASGPKQGSNTKENAGKGALDIFAAEVERELIGKVDEVFGFDAARSGNAED